MMEVGWKRLIVFYIVDILILWLYLISSFLFIWCVVLPCSIWLYSSIGFFVSIICCVLITVMNLYDFFVVNQFILWNISSVVIHFVLCIPSVIIASLFLTIFFFIPEMTFFINSSLNETKVFANKSLVH